MNSLKRKFEDDDGDLRDVDAEGKIDVSDDEAPAGEVADETMEISPDLPKLWLAKLPKTLIDKWLAVPSGEVQLAQIHIYGQDSHPQAVRLVLPENPPYDASLESQVYRFDLGGGPTPSEISRYVFTDEPKHYPNEEDTPSAAKRLRATKLVASATPPVNVVPVGSSDEKYAQRFRHLNKKTRGIVFMDDDKNGPLTPLDKRKAGPRPNLKMIAAGVNTADAKINFAAHAPKKGKQAQDRFTRMPRNELIDRLMLLFKQQNFWSFKELKAQVEQPEDHLRETLPLIAISHKSGPHTNKWELNATQKASLEVELQIIGETIAGPSRANRVKFEDNIKSEAVDHMDDDGDDDEGRDDDDEEEDEDEEEFEEVMA